jgi:hypothetical protein
LRCQLEEQNLFPNLVLLLRWGIDSLKAGRKRPIDASVDRRDLVTATENFDAVELYITRSPIADMIKAIIVPTYVWCHRAAKKAILIVGDKRCRSG